METSALLDPIIYAFRDLFGSQNFVLFYAYVWGVLLCTGRQTVTRIYQAGQPPTRYWSVVKFLSRGQWDWEQVSLRLIRVLVTVLPSWVYVYDQTYAIKTGKKQFGLHFFRNHRYQKRNTNQSKFHWGHEFAALGLLGLTATGAWLFPVWVRLLAPEAVASSALVAFQALVVVLPPGLIIFDRGFNNRKYFTALLDAGHHLLCRARKNAAFYDPAAPPRLPRRGRPKRYGKRVHVEHWWYTDRYMPAVGKTLSVAHQIVRTKLCPVPVHLVVVRTRPSPTKPYRYFLVYTTDLTLSVETIVRYYKLRWTFETGMHDSKESFGFDHYQVRSATAIQRSVLLSFVATSLTQILAFVAEQPVAPGVLPSLIVGLQAMNIHWYHPQRWTLGLITCYLRWHHSRHLFSASFSVNKNLRKKDISLYRATG
jgi:hypothetical protein